MFSKLIIVVALFLTCLYNIDAASAPPTPSVTGSMSMTFANPAPQNFMNTCPNKTSKVCLKWNDAPGYPADYYLLMINWGTMWKNFTIGGLNDKVDIVNLTAGTLYNFYLQAFRYGVPSAMASLTVMTQAAQPCDNASNLIDLATFTCFAEGTGDKKSVVCTWKNGVVMYTEINVVVDCFFRKNNKVTRKKKVYRRTLRTPGLERFVVKNNANRVDTCELKQEDKNDDSVQEHNPKILYGVPPDQCCQGCGRHDDDRDDD